MVQLIVYCYQVMDIFVFGRNKYGELGNQKEENELSPHRIKIEKNSFIFHRVGHVLVVFQ